jgi:hypothetical protein
MTMTTTRRLLHAVLAAALLAALPAQAAVSGVMTYSGILKSAAGTPVTTSTNITFRLYTASSGGTAIWNDTVAVTPGADGWFSAPLGILNPLVPSTLGQDLYLSLQVGTDVEFTQRARVTPSGSALAVDWSGVQGKPTCATGQYLTLNGSGGLLCSAPAGGTGGVTSVGVTAPVTNSGSSTAPVIGMGAASTSANGYLSSGDWSTFNAKAPSPGAAACLPGQVLTWGGTPLAFSCVADTNSGGTITSVVAGAGLTGGATSGAATLSVGFAGTGVATTAARSDHSHDFGITGTQVSMSGAPVTIVGATTAWTQALALTVPAGTSNNVALTAHVYLEKSATLFGRYGISLNRVSCAGVVVGSAWWRSSAPTAANDSWVGSTTTVTGFDTGVTGSTNYVLCVQKFDTNAADLTIVARGMTATWSK